MSDTIIISVDGENGSTAAQDDAFDPAVFETQVDPLQGDHGRNAARSLPGGPGGDLAVMLTQSSVVAGGICVDIVSNGSLHQLPPVIEVAPNRIVRFSARGGDGQAGGIGENGEMGKPGEDGVSATRTTDATDGSQGGKGGNAGSGSGGGDGGDGGNLEIQVPDSMTHLLFAVEWDTNGGHGGVAGQHGKPGEGGLGGAGGDSIEWEEHLGYNFTCTPECVGKLGRGGQDPMRRMLEWGRDSSRNPDLTKPQIVHGQNMALVTQAITQRHKGFSRQAQAPYGTCKCAGGATHCASCKRTELNTTMVRPRGKNGPPGERGGYAPPFRLLPGISGNPGVGKIKVLHGDGTEQTYSSRYRLELVSFEIRDENQDGIFEPGECIIIRSIRIKNSGGMPSPGCPITITVLPSKWIEPLEDEDGKIFLSQSLPVGESVTIGGEIKAWIKTPETTVKVGALFLEEDDVSLTATMPWLDQALDTFTWKKEVTIQYPLELGGLNILKSLVPSSKNKFTIAIRNKSSKTYGRSGPTKRAVKVTLAFPSDRGALLSRGTDWDNTNPSDITVLAPNSIAKSEQFIGVTSNAEINSSAIIRVCLHLSLPESGTEQVDEEWDAPEHLQLIQQSDVKINISPAYDYTDDASFLLITNPSTPPDLIQAMKSLVQDDMKLQLDEWNLGQHGGFYYPTESSEETRISVLTSYVGKSIIFIGNDFDYFGQGLRNSLELCDLVDVAASSLEGTISLFLGYNEKKHHDFLNSIIFPVDHNLQDPSKFIKETTNFPTRKELLQAISQQQTIGSSKFTTYTLFVKPSIRGGNDEATRKEADAVVEDLRSQLSQERFLVSHLYPLSSIMDDENSITLPAKGKLVKGDRDFGLVVVYRGLPHRSSIRMAASHPIQQIRVQQNKEGSSRRVSSLGQVTHLPTTKATLDPFDAYMVVSSLPLNDRVTMLFNDAVSFPTFIQEACELSLIQDFCAEIGILLDSASSIDSSLSLKKLTDNDILTLHFSHFSTLLKHSALKGCITIPDRILKILRYTLTAAYPTKKRHMISSQRSQVRQFLTKVIDEVLRRKGLEDSLAEFHAQAKKEAAKLQGIIANEVSVLTKKPEHEYERSLKDSSEMVRRTSYCKSREWDLRVMEIENARVEREKGLEKAREVLGEMTVL